MGKLDGKAAIVTGAGQGVGRGVALALAKEGARVVIAEHKPDTARAVEEEIRQLGKEAMAVPCDVGNEQQVKQMVARAAATFGPIDILVNNAQSWTGGTAYHLGSPIESMPEEWWDLAFQSGLKGTVYCCKAVFPYMKDRGGKIINFASLMGIVGWEGSADYNANKEAIRGFTRTAAREWGKYQINVNVICPSALTPAMLAFAEASPEKVAEMSKELERIPLRRVGDAEKDIGRVAVFLASEDSDFITGHTFMVDGGAHMF
ncbi:MAG: SDR family oxidoreductase [Dehalococcoidia bacterium]|nr:SDR family oxidoreductase [Dehalococcoidia bacterium]